MYPNETSFTVRCTLNATFPVGMTYTWFRNGHFVISVTIQPNKFPTSTTFLKRNVPMSQPSDTDVYQCVFNNTEYFLRRNITVLGMENILH